MSWSNKDWDDYIRGQPGTFWGDLKQQQMRDYNYNSTTAVKSSTENFRDSPSSTTDEPLSFQTLIARILGTSLAFVFCCILYTLSPDIVWYWYIVVFFVSAAAMQLLLDGPLRPVVRLISTILALCLFAAAGYGVLHLLYL